MEFSTSCEINVFWGKKQINNAFNGDKVLNNNEKSPSTIVYVLRPSIFVRHKYLFTMRPFLLFLLLALSSSLLAQWQGDTSKYEIYPDSLHLNDTAKATSTAYLSKFSDVIEDATWEFTVHIKEGTSSSNLAEVHLVSDVATLDGNGYYVKIGLTADEVSLYRQDDGSGTKIIDGTDKRIDTKPMIVSVKVLRSEEGNWQLFSKLDSEPAYVKEGEIQDKQYRQSSFFGVYSRYTSTRFDETDFYHFSITGSAFTDNVPPRLDSAIAITKYKAQLYFNEAVKVNVIKMQNEAADDVLIEDKVVTASFKNPFLANDSNLLHIDVTDTTGNVFLADAKIYYKTYEVLFATMQSPNLLEFKFNKPTSSVVPQNITLDGQQPSALSVDNNVWQATFLSPLGNGVPVDLSIENIRDIHGDTLQSYSQKITYFVAQNRDVVINELMPDPTPKLTILPEVEYLELHNTHDFEIVLNNWYFQKDNDTRYLLPTVSIAPQGFFLLGSEAAMDSFPDIHNKIAMPFFPSLTNSGMTLRLKSDQDILIDSLTYNVNWHTREAKDGGYALSRINPQGESVELNFQSSCAPDGGTPGRANCDLPPFLDSLRVLTHNTAIFYFNEEVFVNSVTYAGAAATQTIIAANNVEVAFATSFLEKDSSLVSIQVQDINGNVLDTLLKVYYQPLDVMAAEMDDATHLHLTFNKPLQELLTSHILLDGQQPSSISYDTGVYIALFSMPLENRTTVSLQVSGVVDYYGDVLKDYNDNITFFKAQLGDVVFNELMSDPSPVINDLPEAEYLELYNTTDFSINLGDWQLIKEDKSYSLPTYQMAAGEYLLLCPESALALFPDHIQKLGLSSFPTLNNSGMSLLLKSKKDDLVDFIDYDNKWHEDAFKGAGGFSLERIDVYNPSQLDNWGSSCSANGGTPGVENCVADYNPDLERPYVVNAYALDNRWLMVNLSEPIMKAELLKLAYYSFSDGLFIQTAIPLGEMVVTTQVMLGLSEAMEDQRVYEIAIEGIQDLSANEMDESRHNVAICVLPTASQIVINEIMVAPLTGEAEYVEIYNNTDVPFDLEQLKITKQEDDGTWAAGKALSTSPQLLLPRAYLALSADADLLSEQYTISDDALLAVSAMTTLPNESGSVGLLLANATVIDSLNYSDEWHSPLLHNTRGVALERLGADAPTNMSTNWFSASSLVSYGTPGAENSQRTDATVVAELKVLPETFTPDGDGQDDFTTIHIDNKYEGGTVRIQVFNHRGTVMKELVNNAFIGAYSNIRWDGTDNNGVRCPMGSYIIWVEIVTPQGNVVSEKMECVISVRMR